MKKDCSLFNGCANTSPVEISALKVPGTSQWPVLLLDLLDLKWALQTESLYSPSQVVLEKN